MKDCAEHCNNRGYFSFVTGVKWADEHPKQPWIKLKDKSPETGFPNYVLVNRHDGLEDVFTACLAYCEGELHWDIYGVGTTPVEDGDYWMPIPKLEEE